MKLFLSSLGISYEQAPSFVQLVGKPAYDIRLAFIEYDDGEKGESVHVDENRIAIQALGISVKPIDLNDYKDGLRKEPLLHTLRGCDVIWLGGGNTYYLRWLLKETRADVIIKGLIERGKIYGGGSAGAIVAGPTLKHFEPADDPATAPELIMTGLGLTDTVVVPHWNNEKFGPAVVKIAEKLKADGYKVQVITDSQALVIDGETQEVVP